MYVELQSVLVSGIENNVERDLEAVLEHPELLEKLGHSSSSSSSGSDGNERVIRKLSSRIVTNINVLKQLP